MPVPMQPPPYYAKFLDDSGHISEIWRRFFLATQTSIQFLLQTQQRLGSMQGVLLPEDPAEDRFATIVPGPPGPPGPNAPAAAFGAGFMLGSMDTSDDVLWLPPNHPAAADVNQIMFLGAGATEQGSALWTFDGVTVTETESGAAAVTASPTPPRLQLTMKDGTNWALSILNRTYSALVDNAIQIWQDNVGFFQVQTGGSFVCNFSPTGNMNLLLALRTFQSTAIPAGGTAGKGYLFSNVTNFGIFFGSGAPTLSAAKGSLYLRSDGTTTNDRAYINTDGATTWTGLTTVA